MKMVIGDGILFFRGYLTRY